MDAAETVGRAHGEMMTLVSYLAAQLIRGGISDREQMISDLEKWAAQGDPLKTFATVAETLKKTRPWEVIEGGLANDGGAGAA